MKYIVQLFRFFVGILFIFSGLIKINDPVGTEIKLEEYFEVFATDFSSFFHHFIPMALTLSVVMSVLEVVLGVALLLKYRMKITTWALLLLIVFFTFLTFYSAYFNKVTDCGCFGDAIKLTPWQSFSKDIVLLVMIVVLFFWRNKLQPAVGPTAGALWVGGSFLASTFVAVYAILHLPFIDFRPYKVGANIPQAMKPSGEFKYEYIMEKGGKTETFTQYPTDTTYHFKEMVLLNPEVKPKITDYSVWNDEGDFTQQSFEGIKLFVIVQNLKNVNVAAFGPINKLVADLSQTSAVKVEPLVLTSADAAAFEQLRHEVQLALPYYFADATVLKTIMRANPGIWLLQNGTVKGKWHYNDTPTAQEVLGLVR